jgi:predicted metal-dependent peptidase
MTDAFERISIARRRLAIRDHFFGRLLQRLEPVDATAAGRAGVDTMATDGRRLFVHQPYVATLTDDELDGVLCHEVLHCAYRHFSRRGSRPLDRFNIAADYAINLDVLAAGYRLPRGALVDPRFRGMSTESIFDELFGAEPSPKPAPAPEPDGDDGDAAGDVQDGTDGEPDDGADDGTDGATDDGAAVQDGTDGDLDGDDGADGTDGTDGTDGDLDGEGDDGDGEGDDGDGAAGSGSGSEGDDGAAGEGQDGGAGEPGTSAGRGRGGRGTAPDAAGDGTAGDLDGTDGDGTDGTMPCDPGRCGGILDTPADDGDGEAESLSESWQVWTRQAVAAARAKNEGRVPGSLQRIVEDLNAPRVDWRDVLRRFVTDSMVRDYSWTRPNRRFTGEDFVLPGTVTDSLNHLVVVLDTSSSVFDVLDTVSQFGAEVSAMLDDGAADRVTVLHCDTAVRRVDEYGRGDPILSWDPVGGGGTRFSPAFAWIRENATDAAAVLYLTDLDCTDYGEEPAAPVLWAAYGRPSAVESHAARLPFGEVIRVA